MFKYGMASLAIAAAITIVLFSAKVVPDQCFPVGSGLTCAAWSLGVPAVFALGFTAWGVMIFRSYNRSMISATVDFNPDVLWVLFDRPGVEAEVRVSVKRDGMFEVSAWENTWESGSLSNMIILYYGAGQGFEGCPHEVEVPDLYRAIPMTTATDPDVALDDGVLIRGGQAGRLRKLNDRDPSLKPCSAARVRVLGRGFVQEEVARGRMISPTSTGSTRSEEAGMLPEVRAASEMLCRMTDGPEVRRIPVQRVQMSISEAEYWTGTHVRITLQLDNGDSSARPGMGYRLTWSSPEPTRRSETTWTGVGLMQPSYVLTNQAVRDGSNRAALFAGVILATGASFIASLLDRLMIFLSYL